jgi:tRNA U34 5-methylaminomethyl-2-thiouridine-forming methyltransferase MnmC
MLVLRKTPLAATFAENGTSFDSSTLSNPSSATDLPDFFPRPSSPDLPLIMNEYEYADALLDFVSRIPDEWPLMRLTTDAPPETVVAPKWWMSKGQFLEYFKKRASEYRGFDSAGANKTGMPEIITGDGSKTLYHPEYRQHFHSLSGARTEAFKKFVEPCDIRGKLAENDLVRVLDIGFGLGENAFALLETARLAESGKLEIVSLEMDERAPKAALGLVNASPRLESPQDRDSPPDRTAVLASILSNGGYFEEHADLRVVFGDARSTLDQLDGEFHAVFLDPFSHEVNPELWTYDFIGRISAKLAPGGVLATYSAAYPVRGAMTRCGLRVGETPAVGRRKGGTIASFEESAIIAPLSSKTARIIKETTTGTPYRDPQSNWDKRKIRDYRAALVRKLASKGVPKWASA